MKHTFLLTAALAALAGCKSPSPAFMDGTSNTIRVENSTFGVWRVGDQVEVIRTSVEAIPRLSDTMRKAQIAVVQATGCPVKAGSMVGDQAVLKAELDCA